MIEKSLLVLLATTAIDLGGCAAIYERPLDLNLGKSTWKDGAGAISCPEGDRNLCSCDRLGAQATSAIYPTSGKTALMDACGEKAWELERSYYPSINSGKENYPLLGIALSGGGERAASTSIGFLGAMDYKGILAQTDVISSVSGGSYASYWFFSHIYNADIYNAHKTNPREQIVAPSRTQDRYKALFKSVASQTDGTLDDGHYSCKPSSGATSESKFQNHIFCNSRLASKKQNAPGMELEGVAELLTWLPSIPIHWITAGLFDTKGNYNPLTHYYHAGIERTYGLYPTSNEDPPARFMNAVPLNFRNRVDITMVPAYEARDPTWTQIKDFHDFGMQDEAKRIPFWIVNATAAYGGRAKMFRVGDFGGFSHDLRDTVYEFTPIHYGSPRFGYCQYPSQPLAAVPLDRYGICSPVDAKLVKYGRVVGASGAAVDGLNPTLNVLLDVFNLSIGRYIENPKVPKSVRDDHDGLPFPFYGLHRPFHNEASPSIYLTDGGHAENLGLYSLIRRRVKNIIVLDAEQEPESREKNGERHMAAVFAAFQELRCRLYKENGVELQMAKVEISTDNSDSGINAVQRSSNTPFGMVSSAGQRIATSKPCDTASREQIAFDVQKQPFPYFEGWICLDTSDSKRDCDASNRLNILYVKLAIDGAGIESNSDRRYNDHVRKHFQDNSKIFPHDPTGDIWFSRDKYLAYRNLGYDLGKCLKFEVNQLALDPTEPGCEKLSTAQPWHHSVVSGTTQ